MHTTRQCFMIAISFFCIVQSLQSSHTRQSQSIRAIADKIELHILSNRARSLFHQVRHNIEHVSASDSQNTIKILELIKPSPQKNAIEHTKNWQEALTIMHAIKDPAHKNILMMLINNEAATLQYADTIDDVQHSDT